MQIKKLKYKKRNKQKHKHTKINVTASANKHLTKAIDKISKRTNPDTP